MGSVLGGFWRKGQRWAVGPMALLIVAVGGVLLLSTGTLLQTGAYSSLRSSCLQCAALGLLPELAPLELLESDLGEATFVGRMSLVPSDVASVFSLRIGTYGPVASIAAAELVLESKKGHCSYSALPQTFSDNAEIKFKADECVLSSLKGERQIGRLVIRASGAKGLAVGVYKLDSMHFCPPWAAVGTTISAV